MKKLIKTTALSLSVLLLATPSFAVTYRHYYYHHHRHRAWAGGWYGGYSAYSEAPAGSPRCVRLCSADLNPCDPLYFKQADGRCSRGLP